MRVLIGFTGTTNYKKLTFETGNPQYFSTMAVYEKYQKNYESIDKVICLATEKAHENAMKLKYNLALYGSNPKHLDEAMEKVMEGKVNAEKELNALGVNQRNLDKKFEIIEVKNIENEEELNVTFLQIEEKLQELIKSNNTIELVLDVTNGYRTQPIAAIMIANVLKQKIKDLIIEDVWYSIISEDQKSGKLLSIKKHNELSDWSIGLNNFLKTGDTQLLKTIMQRDKQDFDTTNLVNRLEVFSKSLKVCRMDDIHKTYEDVKEAITIFKDKNRDSEFNLLSSMFNEITTKIELFETTTYYASILWNYEHGNIQQALTICSECFPILVYQYEILYKTNYDLSHPEQCKFNEKDKEIYKLIEAKVKRKDKNMGKQELQEKEVQEKEVFKLIIDDINNLINQNETMNVNDLTVKKMSERSEKLWSQNIKNKNYKIELKSNKRNDYDPFIINLKNFNYLYLLLFVDEFFFKDEKFKERCKQIFNENNIDSADINYQSLRTLYKVNKDTNIKKEIDFIFSVFSQDVGREKPTTVDLSTMLLKIKKDYEEGSEIGILSNYMRKKQNQDDFKKVLDAYNELRKFRNDINHAGTEFAIKMDNYKSNKHGVAEFFSNQSDSKSDLNKQIRRVVQYIKLIETGELLKSE